MENIDTEVENTAASLSPEEMVEILIAANNSMMMRNRLARRINVMREKDVRHSIIVEVSITAYLQNRQIQIILR